MLHSLRKQRYGFSRSVVTVLVALWLSLAFQPCVMASMQAMDSASCDGCPDQHTMVQQDDSSQMDCRDAANCVSMMDEHEMDLAGFAYSLSSNTQPVLIAWEAGYPSFPAPCHNSIDVPNNPADPPPLLRFCILQI